MSGVAKLVQLYKDSTKVATSGVVVTRQPGDKVGSLVDSPITEDIEMRETIAGLEKYLLDQMPETVTGTDVDKVCPLVHHFAPHMYGREILLPAGSLVVGKLHKHSHLNILAQGHVLVATEDGVEELRAPCVWTSKAGTKRVVHAITNTIWVCVHPTETTDLEAIERDTIAVSYTELGLSNLASCGGP